jgi:hypothetical protein
MRKLAYLFAALLAVSLPSAADAAKAKAKHAKAKPAAAKAEKMPDNTAFLRALDDLGRSLAQPQATEKKGAKGKTAKKPSKKAKKA